MGLDVADSSFDKPIKAGTDDKGVYKVKKRSEGRQQKNLKIRKKKLLAVCVCGYV